MTILSFARSATAALILASLAGCQTQPSATAEDTHVRAFLANFEAIEGRAFEGFVDESLTPAGTFVGERLLMRVEEASPDGARIAFAVGDDRSRTWVLTRREGGRLHLRHDHRDPDGTPHDLTDYGGYAAPGGSAVRQTFPADELTASMLPEASTNIWTMEITPEMFAYSLTRHGEPRFRAQFDLTEHR